MKGINITLTYEEYKLLRHIVDKLESSINPTVDNPKKWIRENGYIINTVTGKRFNLTSKKFE